MPRKVSRRKANTPRAVARASRNIIQFHKGHRINVPNHPTEFCSIPWFQLTLRVNNPSSSVTIGGIYNAFVAQLLGLGFTNAYLNMRLLSVRVWGPIPTTNTQLNVQFRDVFDDLVGTTPTGAQNILEDITDYADQVNRARVGYVYSTAQQQKSILVVSGSTEQVITLTGAGAGSVAYFNVLWRPFFTGVNPASNDIPPDECSEDDGIEILPKYTVVASREVAKVKKKTVI